MNAPGIEAATEAVLHLRVKFTVVDLPLEVPEGGELVLDLNGAHHITLRLTRSVQDVKNAEVVATSAVPLHPRMREGFVALTQNRLPEGHKDLGDDHEEFNIHQDGTFDCQMELVEGSVPISVEKACGVSSDGIDLKIGFVGSSYSHDLEAA